MKIRTRLLGTAFAVLGTLGVGAAPAIAAGPNAGQDISIETPCWQLPAGCESPVPDGPDEPDEPEVEDEVEVDEAAPAPAIPAQANFTG